MGRAVVDQIVADFSECGHHMVVLSQRIAKSPGGPAWLEQLEQKYGGFIFPPWKPEKHR